MSKSVTVWDPHLGFAKVSDKIKSWKQKRSLSTWKQAVWLPRWWNHRPNGAFAIMSPFKVWGGAKAYQQLKRLLSKSLEEVALNCSAETSPPNRLAVNNKTINPKGNSERRNGNWYLYSIAILLRKTNKNYNAFAICKVVELCATRISSHLDGWRRALLQILPGYSQLATRKHG